MRKLLLISLLFFCQLLAMAQDADQTVGQLVNSQNWLELNKQYPQLKPRMKSEMLKNIGRNRQTLWGGCTDANPKLLLNDT